jgi:hypothetical protein
MAAKPGASVHQRLRRRVGRIGILEMLQVALVVILVVTALLGGLDTVDTKVTPFRAGESFDDGEFTITIERAVAVERLTATGRGASKPGRRYLGVVATIRNNGTIPGELRNEIDLRDQPGKEFIDTLRMSDNTTIVSLGPKLTENIVFIWQLPESALQPGSTVTLRLWRKDFQEKIISYGKAWIETDKYGEIELPVRVNS